MVDARWERVELAREAQSYSSLNGRLILQTFITTIRRRLPLCWCRLPTILATFPIIDSLRSKADAPEESDLLADIQTKREAYRTSYRHAVDLHVQDRNLMKPGCYGARGFATIGRVHRAMDDYVQYPG